MSAAIAPINPLLLDHSFEIETERLLLRPPRVEDVPHINAAIHESLAELRPWLPWAKDAPSRDDTTANVRGAIAKTVTREDIRIHLHLKDAAGTFIGGSGFHRIDWSVPRVEIGYWIRTKFAGQGYMTEAVSAMTRFALERLKVARVEIVCSSHNKRSLRVAERCGYQLEATLRNHAREVDGSLRSTLIYAKISPLPA
jgi:RimJ/RimL family protein N-acetyltransferase